MNRILFSLLLIFVICCNNPSYSINEKFIEKISVNQDRSLPSAFVKYNLYAKVSEDKILETNVKFLFDIYNDHFKYKYKYFYVFLRDVLNQKTIIPFSISSQYEYGIFNIDNKIIKLTSQDIIKDYLEVGKGGKYYFYLKNFDRNEIRTVLYKLFLDNYLVSFDDYGGKYIITKYK